MSRDPFKGHPTTAMAQGRKLLPIVPDDVNLLPVVPKALLCTAAGSIKVIAADGNLNADGTEGGAALTFNLAAGDVFDFVQVSQVLATGTTATVVGSC